MTNKRILVICQYYKPEPFNISFICEELVKKGFDVQVVTGYPNYPDGILYEGYGRGKRIDEVINGVKVHRCFTVPRKGGIVKRLENYYSYSLSSTKYVLSKNCAASDGRDFDIVFCNQLSPVMMAKAAVAYKKKHKVPAVLYCLDLWPESLAVGGISRNSKIFRYFHKVSGNLYRSFDRILITSRMFSNYLENEFGIEKSKIEYLPQLAENAYQNIPHKQETDIFRFMFAGNIGTAQSIDTIIKAAKILEDEPAEFHIVGSGKELDSLKKLTSELGIDNVVFHGRKPADEMPELYSTADAMLVTLMANETLSYTLPGKVQSYMAAGKPIIAAADGETKNIIDEAKCGFCGKAEDAAELAANIKKYIEAGKEERAAMASNAKEYYDNNFTSRLFFEKFEQCLK